ncbi:MAG TPA: hypothetical protein VF039_08355 [Longimicrobiales bacterium]
MRMLRSTIALAFIVLLAGACASTPTEREIPADGSASAFVLNSGDGSYTVYVQSSSGRVRLGFVEPLSSGRFRVPGELVSAGGPMTLQAEGRGAAGNFLSEPFVLQPGYIVNWRLPDNNVYVR